MTDNHKIRILLADDHAVVRAGIRQFLEMEDDFDVVAEADDGEQAKQLIEQHQPDVAVLDIQMPIFTGIEVTRYVRAHQWQVGILILTAYEENPYVAAVIKAGANGYILKTARPPDIIQAIRDVYQGKSVFDRVIIANIMSTLASQGEIASPSPNLTSRELEVLTLAARGYTNRAIAVQLSISDRTVQGHFANIFEKMHVSSRTEAVMKAVSYGYISTTQ